MKLRRGEIPFLHGGFMGKCVVTALETDRKWKNRFLHPKIIEMAKTMQIQGETTRSAIGRARNRYYQELNTSLLNGSIELTQGEEKMRLVNLTGDPGMDLILKEFDKLLLPGSAMLQDISLKNDFKYNTNMSGGKVAEKLQEVLPRVVQVRVYKSKWPWSAAIGYTDGKGIYLNLRKLGSMTQYDLVGFLIHEWSHLVGFSHGNNYKTSDKCLYSVPYYLSENVSKWLK
jgi:hypothetical protein